MKVSVNVWTVLVGAARLGKSAFAKKLKKHSYDEKYFSTIEFDFTSVWDANYKYQLLELSSNRKLLDCSTYLKRAKLLVFFINPLSENFENEKRDFFQALKNGKYDIESLKGLVVVFSYQDIWKNNSKIEKKLDEVQSQLGLLKKLPCKVLAFSALNSSGKEVLAAMGNMVDDKEQAKQYIQHILAKLLDYQLEASKRIFKPDCSRTLTITNLKNTLSQDISLIGVRQALIDTAKNIRQPKPNGKLKYGVNFFKWHYGDYQNSKLYQLMCDELAVLDNTVDLDKESKPEMHVMTLDEGGNEEFTLYL